MSGSEVMIDSYASSVCDSVPSSEHPSRSTSPDSMKHSYMSVATMANPNGEDLFPFRYKKPERSTQFWFEDGNALLSIENTQYNLHASVLKRHSGYFRDHFLSPLSAQRASVFVTRSPQQPLVLDVDKADFELLLTLLYPLDFAPKYEYSVEEWFRLARASTTLEFPSIRRAALQNIFENCDDAFELVELGRQHNISECLTSAFRMLCFADKPLSLKEGYRIGMDMVIQVAHAREMLARGLKWSELEENFEL